jgi:hypothetical protein
MNQDLEHLRLLAIFHYVLAGIVALVACVPMIHLAFGLVFLFAPEVFQDPSGGGPPPLLFGLLFTILPGVIILLGWTLALCLFLAGRFLARYRHHTFCLVVAGVGCLFMPLGTVLGVFTIIVLIRPSVEALFARTVQGPFAQ